MIRTKVNVLTNEWKKWILVLWCKGLKKIKY